MDESGTDSGGVVTPTRPDSRNRGVDSSGYESVSMLDPKLSVPRFPSAFPVACWWLSLWVFALSLLGFRCPWLVVCFPGPVSFLWGPSLGEARNWPVLRPKRKGTVSDPKIT